MSALPKNLINFDMQPRLERQAAQKTEQLKKRNRRFKQAGLVAIALFAAATQADALIEQALYATLDTHKPGIELKERPDYLVSPEMAAYIVTHAHGELLTEFDMQ